MRADRGDQDAAGLLRTREVLRHRYGRISLQFGSTLTLNDIRDDLNLKTFEVTDSGLQNNGQGGQPRQQEQQQRNSPAYSSFGTETQSSTESLDDIGPQETASQALSLLA